MAHLLGGLAAAAAGHWKRSLAIVFAVLVGSACWRARRRLVHRRLLDAGTESQQALDLLEERFPAQSGDTATVVFSVDDGTLRDGARAAAIDRDRRRDRASSRTSPRVADPLTAEGQVSRDGRIAFATVQYDEPAIDLGKRARRAPRGRPPSTAERAGRRRLRRGQVVDQAEQREAPVGELIGIAVAVLVLTLVFRSAAAMLLTLVSRAARARRRDHAADVRLRVRGLPELRADARRDARPRRRDRLRAADRRALSRAARGRRQRAARGARVANATAGISIVAAGAIVVVAIAGLLATGIPFVGRMGVGSAIIVASVARRRRHAAAGLDGCVRAPPAPEEARARPALAGLRALGQCSPRGRGSPPSRHAAPASCSPRRSRRCGSASPTTATSRPHDAAARLRQAGRGLRPGLQRPAAAGRRPPVRTAGAGRRSSALRAAVERTRRTSPRHRRAAARTRRGDAATITRDPELTAGRSAPPISSSACATT